jgi:capsular polysaccharide biosynthesis protein
VTLGQIVAVMRARRRALVAGALLATLFAAAFALIVGPSYAATARVLLTRPQASLSGGEGLLTTENLNLQALTYAQVVVSRDFVDNALKQAGVNNGGVRLTATVEQNTAVLVIKTQAPTAQRANAAARAVDTALGEEISLAGRSAAGLAAASRVIQSPDANRSSTGVLFAAFVGFVLGLSVSVTFVLLTEGR